MFGLEKEDKGQPDPKDLVESPNICSLATEILCLIFQFACGPSPFSTAGRVPRSPSEIPLSHVCQRWRAISIAHPELWSIISFDSCPHFMTEKVVLGQVSTYLERSQNNLLDIWIRFNVDEPPSPDFIFSVLGRLLGHESRWRHLSLHIPFTGLDPIHPFLRRLQSPVAPSLESLQITSKITHDARPSIQTPTFSNGTPNLTHVRLDTLIFGHFFPSPYSITTLHIEGQATLYPFAFFLTLVASPALTTLSIAYTCFQQPTGKLSPVISPSLKHFRCSDDTTTRHLWMSVEAPNLELLILNDAYIPWLSFPPHQYQQPRQIDYNPFPSLVTLVLTNCTISSLSVGLHTNVFLFVATTSMVKHIYIQNSRSTESIMQDMIKGYKAYSFIFWPSADSLTFEAEDLEDQDQAFFQDFLQTAQVFSLRRDGRKRRRIRLTEDNVDAWRRKDPSSWSKMEEGGYYEKMAGTRQRDVPMSDFNSSQILDWRTHTPFLHWRE